MYEKQTFKNLFHKNIVAKAVMFICICYIGCSYAKNAVYFYEPYLAELEGTIVKKEIDCNCGTEKDLYEKSIDGNNGGLFGYDPDYEVKDNFRDLQSECVFLLLDEPIDVRKPEGHFVMSGDPKRNSISEKNVEVLQMSNDDPINPHFNIGDRVSVDGALYRHVLKCDHSRVLIDVGEIKIIKSTKSKYQPSKFEYILGRIGNFKAWLLSKNI